MKLYSHPASPNCVAVLMTAAQLDLALEIEFVDLLGGAQRSPAFRAINPNGLVPSLVDDSFVLWETQAIIQYLAATVPDTPLWPNNARSRADIARWQFWAVAHWMPALRPFLYENVFKALKGEGGPDPAVLENAEAAFDAPAHVLDSCLGDRSFAVGEGMTLADIALASYLMYAQPARVPLQQYPRIRGWLDSIERMPSWQKATARATSLFEAASVRLAPQVMA